MFIIQTMLRPALVLATLLSGVSAHAALNETAGDGSTTHLGRQNYDIVAKKGADDRPGHARRGRGRDDGPNHTYLLRNADEHGVQTARRGSDDATAGHSHKGRGSDDAHGDDHDGRRS